MKGSKPGCVCPGILHCWQEYYGVCTHEKAIFRRLIIGVSFSTLTSIHYSRRELDVGRTMLYFHHLSLSFSFYIHIYIYFQNAFFLSSHYSVLVRGVNRSVTMILSFSFIYQFSIRENLFIQFFTRISVCLFVNETARIEERKAQRFIYFQPFDV